MVLSLRLRRLRLARGLQAGAEKVDSRNLKGTASGTGDKREAEQISDGTMMELLRLKVSGDISDHRREGEPRRLNVFVPLFVFFCLHLCLSSRHSTCILTHILLQVSTTVDIDGGSVGDSNGGDIPPIVIAAPQQFPVPPPPEIFQSEENLRAYVYKDERSSILSGE